MNSSQKIILAVLGVAAVAVFAAIGCAAIFLISSRPALDAPPPVVAAVTPTEAPVATVTPLATATVTSAPTLPPEPTATATKVVVSTVLPSPTPTVANCIGNITNFQASGLLTNEEVELYVAQAIPANHLDNCRAIKFFAIDAAAHGTPIAGNFVPVYREINVYGTGGDLQTEQDLLDTVVHEIGHNVHYNIRRNNFDLDVQWAELFRQSQATFREDGLGFVSNYARTNKFEDFAESYRTYVREPEMLLFFNVAKYEYMRQQVFDGREY